MFECPVISYIWAITAELPAHRPGSVFPYFLQSMSLLEDFRLSSGEHSPSPSLILHSLFLCQRACSFPVFSSESEFSGKKARMGGRCWYEEVEHGWHKGCYITTQEGLQKLNCWNFFINVLSSCCWISWEFFLLFLRLSSLLPMVCLLLTTSMEVNANQNEYLSHLCFLYWWYDFILIFLF